ncbi:MAG: lipid-A-disaccharide synthase [Pseudomonadota bacterium]
MSHNSRTIMIVAGEPSGDLHGSNLVVAMREIDPGLQFRGIGGRRMQEAGVELMAHAADMAVVGLTEVIVKLNQIRKVLNLMKTHLKTSRPDLLILIDYPDFNLMLGKAAKAIGVRVFYYISPQVWAWRRGRIKKIRAIVDKMAVILPFEEPLYRNADVDATYIGHPLLDTVKTKYSRQEALEKFGLQEGATTVGLMPGSRDAEIARLLPVMMNASEIMVKKLPRLQFVLPLAETLERAFVENILQQSPVPVRIIQHDTYDAIDLSDIVIVASGTATLETALLGKPMVIVYKVSPVSYYIGKKIVRVEHIGLANIIAGKTIVPELIQDEANPERIATEVVNILNDPTRMQDIRQELDLIREKLGGSGAAGRAARLACDMLSISNFK